MHLFFLFFILLFPAAAHAGYALPSSPAIATSGGVTTYNAALGAANDSIVHGRVTTSVSAQIGARTVSMPATARLAANAPRIAATAIRLNPYAIAIALLAPVALDLGWRLIDGYLQKPNGDYIYPADDGFYWRWPNCSGAAYCSDISKKGYLQYMQAKFPKFYAREQDVYIANLGSTPYTTNYGINMYSQPIYIPAYVVVSSANYPERLNPCQSGSVRDKNYGCVVPASTPITEADDAALAQKIAENDAILKEAAKIQPLPIEQPSIQPGSAPVSSPYTDPVTGKKVQDVAYYDPDPTADSPLRLRYEVYKEPVPDGKTEIEPKTNPEPNPDAEKQTDFCAQHSNSIICQDGNPQIDNPAMPELPKLYERKFPDGLSGVWNSKSQSFKQTGIFALISALTPSWASSSSCPSWSLSPLSMGGRVYPMGSLDVPCYVFSFIRWALIVTALFMARRLIFGG